MLLEHILSLKMRNRQGNLLSHCHILGNKQICIVIIQEEYMQRPFRHFTRTQSVEIAIPRRCAIVSVTRNVVGRCYTNITWVKITWVIFNPGQKDASVDEAYYYVISFKMNKSLLVLVTQTSTTVTRTSTS